jgi:hypothetical protein
MVEQVISHEADEIDFDDPLEAELSGEMGQSKMIVVSTTIASASSRLIRPRQPSEAL